MTAVPASTVLEVRDLSVTIGEVYPLGEDERLRRQREHTSEVMERMSPDMVIHTGGVRLAATGGMDFLHRYVELSTSIVWLNYTLFMLGVSLILSAIFIGLAKHPPH